MRFIAELFSNMYTCQWLVVDALAFPEIVEKQIEAGKM